MKVKETVFKWVAGAMGILLLSYGFLLWQRKATAPPADMKLYFSVSTQLSEGKIPYRDFTVEYPPLALLPLAIPHLLTAGLTLDYRAYSLLYLLETFLLLLLIAFTLQQVARLWPESLSPWRLLAVYLLLVILSKDFVFWRYDLFPAWLTLLALLAVLKKQPLLAGMWIGLAIMAKLYPVILVPVMLVYYLAGQQYRASVRLVAGTGLAVALVLLPVVLLSGNQVFSFLTYHQLRGLQIESVAAGLVLLGHLTDLTRVSTEFNYGAFHLEASGVGPVLKALPVVFLAAFSGLLALGWFRFRREYGQTGTVSADSLLRFLLGALLVFISTNKVFSPQYLIWLLPFVLFLPVKQIAWMGFIFLLTTLVYPVFYGQLVDPTVFGVLLLTARNGFFLFFFVYILRKKRPSSSLPNLSPTLYPNG
ncbi:glycosyltransferase family 87 protein [Larkinella punicea]|uniref:glycosyltransferase family 87 protein n=1 Tax=Larkinella punicea TaxID=2315727 RepID=UPI001402E644|nr:glycosyltransferase family 87 protein [Larkinella punicea]